MAEPGFQDHPSITVDENSMKEGAGTIGAEVDTLEKVDLPTGDASTVTVRANGDVAYQSSQELTEKFISAIQQDANNIISVWNEYEKLDIEVKRQIVSLID